MKPVTGFWIFAACAALGLGLTNMNAQPTLAQIEASARKETAMRMAERGAAPAVIDCILNPPAFSWHCKDLLKAMSVK